MKQILLLISGYAICCLEIYAQSYQYQSSTSTSWPYDKSEGENVQEANRYDLNDPSDNTENFVTELIDIPFEWYFYGNPVSQYRIYTSGYISFDSNDTNVYDDNSSLPPSSCPLNSIYAFWDDLGLVGGFMETNNYGEKPNRVHVIQWRSMRNPLSSTKMCDFAIRLYECGGFDIVHNYSSDGFSGTIGCVNEDATDYTLVSGSPSLTYSLSSVNTDDKVFSFYYNDQADYDATIEDLDIDENITVGNINLSGTFFNKGAQSISTFKVNYSLNGGSLVSETINSGSSIASGQSYQFSLSNAISFSTAGKIDALKIWASDLDGNADIINCNDTLEMVLLTINNTSSEKHVLVEEYTSTGCQKCPEGHMILDTLKEDYPNTSLVVFCAGDDLDADFMESWQSAFYFSGYPDGLVDRYYWEGRPRESINSYDDWDDYAIESFDHFSPLAVSINGTYNDTTRQLEALVSTEFSDYAKGDLNINLYLTEDSVIAPQSNAFDNTVGHPLYGLGNPIPEYAHHHLMRDNLGSEWGISGVIPSYVTPGEKYSYSFNYTVPSNYQSKQLKLVAFVSKNEGVNHRNILNANEVSLANLSPVDTSSSSSIIGITIEVGIVVKPMPVKGTAVVTLSVFKPGSFGLALYTAKGVLVKTIAPTQYYQKGTYNYTFDASNLASGMYLLSASGKTGNKTIKLNVAQ
jgi:hypothetical protein